MSLIQTIFFIIFYIEKLVHVCNTRGWPNFTLKFETEICETNFPNHLIRKIISLQLVVNCSHKKVSLHKKEWS